MDFLETHQAETYYLVGDVIDVWRLKRGWHWPQAHNDVVQAFPSRAQAGARMILIPGNHDEVMRMCPGTHFGGIEVVPEATFTSADGRRFLVTHGDRFDAVVRNARWLAHLGDRAYDAALWLNIWLNRIRGLWGRQYWSLSNWCKQQVKQAVNFVSDYENVLAQEARRGGYHGVICGHIHSANMRRIEEIEYVNTGDWVESCTAVVERADGSLHIIDWAATVRRRHALKDARAHVQPRRKSRVASMDGRAA